MANESVYTIFQDGGQHQKDHAAFRRWQSDNPSGYVLNLRVGKPPMLHRSLCPHIENFSDPRASLTATAKFCSTDRATLMSNIRELSLDYERCGNNHCFGKQFWINILLTILGYIPGIVHAVWVIAKY